jgi:hypothetical protein
MYPDRAAVLEWGTRVIERRRNDRRRSLLGARVVFDNRSSTLKCTIRNYSEDGALLEFGETPYVPDMIEIVLDNHRTLASAQIVWRNNRWVGIIFPRGQFMAELRQIAERNLLDLAGPAPGMSVH